MLVADETCLAFDLRLAVEDEASGDELVPLRWTLRGKDGRAMIAAIGKRLNDQPLEPQQGSVDFAAWRAKASPGGKVGADTCSSPGSPAPEPFTASMDVP